MAYAKSVEEFYARETPWKAELLILRTIMLSLDLDEELKWGMPHYHVGETNLLGICAFKSYFGIWFHQGAKLSDPAGVLTNAQPGKTKLMRQWRMTSPDDLNETLIREYVSEAIRLVEVT